MSRTLHQTSRIMDMRPSHFNSLCLMLDPDGSWKDLAARVHDRMGNPMLGNDQILNIEHGRESQTKQVLQCWSTTNPTLLDLRDVLRSMKHFRAADFINVEVLKRPPMFSHLIPHPATLGKGYNSYDGLDNGDHQNSSLDSECRTLTNTATQENSRVLNFEMSSGDSKDLNCPQETIRKDVYESDQRSTRLLPIRSLVEEPVSEHMAVIHRFDLCELEELTHNFDETPTREGGNLLGQGGFGKVYKGQKPGRASVAVKCFDPEVICSDEALARKQFITEMDTLVKCNHTNILRLIGYCVETQWCIVYEYMCNGSLEDRLACLGGTPPLSVACRLSIVQGVAHGIDYLHHNFTPALVHRDIKSANVLLDKNFVAKIGDCGTVRLGPRDPEATHTMVVSGVIGTQAYMPPEYLENRAVSPKLDAYSYGVVLLEIITGLKPSDTNREDKLLPTHVREMVDDCEEEILTITDENVRPWRDDLVLAIYRTSKRLMVHHKRRATVSEMLSEIDSWSEESSES